MSQAYPLFALALAVVVPLLVRVVLVAVVGAFLGATISRLPPVLHTLLLSVLEGLAT